VFDADGFAAAVRRAMDQRGLSREAVADATGLSDGSVRRAQNGLAVSVDTVWALLHWLREAHPLRFSLVVEADPEPDYEEETA
jgi:transcriptional regulator with XRE-family HTH domain